MSAVQVVINGETRELPAGLTVSALLSLLGLTQGPVAVERNREIVPRAEHASTRVEDRDVLEIVHFVGGG